MSEQRTERQEDARSQTVTSFYAEMMQKLVGRQETGSPCAELMSQCFDLKGCGDEFPETMSQMMASCCAIQEGAEGDSKKA